MKKKSKQVPWGLGNKIVMPFFNQDQRFYDYLCDFLREVPEIKEALTDPETKEIVETFIQGPVPYTDLLLSIGFVLGSKFELVDKDALKALDFIWRWMKEKEWFYLYPAEERIKTIKQKGCNPKLIDLS